MSAEATGAVGRQQPPHLVGRGVVRGVECGDAGVAPFFTVEELVSRWFTETTANTDKTNRDNVRDLISSGVLPGRKIGRRWYVHLRAVEAYESGRDDPAVMRHPESRALVDQPAPRGVA